MPRRPFDPGRPRQPLRAKAKKDENLGTRQAPRRLLNFKLDWQAYFRRFAGHHGGRHGNGVEISFHAGVDPRLRPAGGVEVACVHYPDPDEDAQPGASGRS